MKEIKLTQGKVALVDDEDFEYLNQFNWYANKDRNTWYAVRFTKKKGHGKRIAMHRVILNTPDGLTVDHKDHDGLNNQKYNLRNATYRQNQMNKTPSKTGTSKYLGVSISNGKQIMAQITINKEKVYLGTFKTEELAAIAYDNAAMEYCKEFANLNFK